MLCLQVFILQCTYENSWPKSIGFVCMLSDSMKLILVMELFIKLLDVYYNNATVMILHEKPNSYGGILTHIFPLGSFVLSF